MTEVEQPPQNGIDPTAGDDDENNKARPADIEQDMREMERRKRVEAIMGSKLFREELERIVDSAREGGAGASGILQQLSDIVGVPVTRVSNVFKSGSCMVPINDIRGVESMGYAKGEKILRCKLAATFRLLDLYGWTQGLGAQITARLKVDQEYFLVNPYGLLYHEITASALNKVDMQGNIVEQGTTNFGVNKSHFVLHSAVHAARPDIRCAIYIGCSPVVAISSLKNGLLPLTKDACVLGEISTHSYTGLFDEDERNRLVRSLGPNSKVILLTNHGALCCGETIEEAFYAACHIVQACETQLKLLPVGLDNLVLIPEESRKHIYEQSRRPPEDLAKKFAAIAADGEEGAVAAKEEAPPKIGSPPKWRVGGAEFEALMRMLDNAGYRTGYIYRHPLIKSDPPKPKNDVELPPAVSSLGYLLEEEELFRQGIWKKGDLRKGGDRSRWLNSPNVYQKVEVLETGTPDPKKITKWVAEGSPTHSTPVRIEDPLQFVPAGTTTKEFKRVQQQIKDNRRADKISAGPQSHILEGVTWDEANRIKDATVSQTGDHVVLMGAASKGIIQRGFQHNATVYKAPYAKNPFDNVTDDELNEYKRTVERKKKSIHGEYTDTDFSESEALNSMQAAGAHAHAKHAQSEPETEHQVIQIQTQQAPIPSQAEVVLSDATLSFINGERSHTATNRKPPTGREYQDCSSDKEQLSSEESNNNDRAQHELNKDEQQREKRSQEASSSLLSTSKCRRELLPSFTNPNPNSSSSPCPTNSSVGNVVDLTQISDALCVPEDVYAYAGAAVSLTRCCQPQVCTALLQGIHAEHLQNSACYRNGVGGTRSSVSFSTANTPRTAQTLVNGVPSPYRTVSHFGFISPRQTPRAEHRHLPVGADGTRYRAMQRAISYEEIFATPRYEQLCHSCFDQLLRLKPELQRRSTASSSGDEPDDLGSYTSSNAITPHHLSTLVELHDEQEFEESLDPTRPALASTLCHVSTQTATFNCGNFLSRIERFNFSDESTNVNYMPGLHTMTSDVQTPTSPGASVTSAPPMKAALAGLEPSAVDPNATKTDITEVWNFGNWQEKAPLVELEQLQQPLTEHRLTLEITQQFNAQREHNAATEKQVPDGQSARPLMSRDERQRRQLEFHDLWQDHVDYFAAKEDMEQEPSGTSQHTVTISLEADEEQTLQNYGWLKSSGQHEIEIQEEAGNEVQSILDEGTINQAAAEDLPKMLQQFEQSLSTAGENLIQLVATTKKLQLEEPHEAATDEGEEEATVENFGCLYRAISLENIADADESVAVSLELQHVVITELSTDDETQPEENEHEHEEKRDAEKPVAPSPDLRTTNDKELNAIAEKDVDENDRKEDPNPNERNVNEEIYVEEEYDGDELEEYASVEVKENDVEGNDAYKNDVIESNADAISYMWRNYVAEVAVEEKDVEENQVKEYGEKENADLAEMNEIYVCEKADIDEKNAPEQDANVDNVYEVKACEEFVNEIVIKDHHKDESEATNAKELYESNAVDEIILNESKNDEKKVLESDVKTDNIDENVNVNIDVDENRLDHSYSKKVENTSLHDQLALSNTIEPVEGLTTPQRQQTKNDSKSSEPNIFSPLEREILERIEVDKLKERESIFGRIDESIRNKLIPCKLENIANNTEEIFHTCTHIIKTPSPTKRPPTTAVCEDTPHLFQFSSEPRPSYSVHSINAPTTSSAHVHLINRKTPRASRSWSSYPDSSESSSSASTQSLQRTISASTFVLSSRRRGQQRNFIQENIRNASKPRAAYKPPATKSAGKSRKHVQENNNDSSAVCAFQAERRDSGARLWVSLPASPRAVVRKQHNLNTSKRVYAAPNPSPSVPYTKRRKPIGIQASKIRRNLRSMSSGTFFMPESCSLQPTVSSTTFALSNSPNDSQAEDLDNCATVSSSIHNGSSRNADGSSFYYSANDIQLPEDYCHNEPDVAADSSNSCSSSNELQIELSSSESDEQAPAYVENLNRGAFEARLGGGTVGLTDASSSEGDISLPGYAMPDDAAAQSAAPSDEQETNMREFATDHNAEQNNQTVQYSSMELPAVTSEASSMVATASSSYEKMSTENEYNEEEEGQPTQSDSCNESAEETDTKISNKHNYAACRQATCDESNVETLTTILQMANLENSANAENNFAEIRETTGYAHDPSDYVKEDQSDGEDNAKNANLSAFSLRSNHATLSLNQQKNLRKKTEGNESTDYSSDSETLLKTVKNLQTTNLNDSESDDNIPNTSAAAASKQKRKSAGGSAEATETECVVIITESRLRDGTLYVTEETESDVIQAPRCANADYHRDKWNIPSSEEDFWNLLAQAGDDENIGEFELIIYAESDAEELEVAEPMEPDIAVRQDTEESVIVELPHGSYNDLGQLELEFDPTIFMTDSSYANATNTDGWPLNGPYDFGSFVVECALGGEQATFFVDHQTAAVNPVDTLEITQNAVNQAMDVEHDINAEDFFFPVTPAADTAESNVEHNFPHE